jgi:hypothetical protein
MKRVVVKVRRKFNKALLEKRYQELMEKAYNFRQTDAGLSDFFDFEASKLQKRINH